MRLFEFDNTITYRSGFIDPVTPKFTQEMLDNELYVDDDTRAFKKWWVNPSKYFERGGVFSLAYSDDELIAVGAITIPADGKTWTVPNHDETYVMFGQAGFFVKDEYRRTGIAKTLAEALEKSFLNTYPSYNTDEYAPVVFCSRATCDIVHKYFNKVISDKELSRRLEQTKQ